MSESDKTPLEMVLETDEERMRLLRQKKCIERLLDGAVATPEGEYIAHPIIK